jgi:hypothetical protein
MNTIPTVWLIKLLLSHLFTDFLLQPDSWVKDRKEKHFASVKLYMHGFLTGAIAWIMLGWSYWISAIIVLVTHTLVDGWKSYKKETVFYFLIDQLLHIAVILSCWYFNFYRWNNLQEFISRVNTDRQFWTIAAIAVFLTTPAGILIGKLTNQWRQKIADAESLANAGKWIGIIERLIVFVMVLESQYSAIGLLVTAKGIIRFNEKDRPETKTEYLVIGTLLSIGIAIGTGLLTKI